MAILVTAGYQLAINQLTLFHTMVVLHIFSLLSINFVTRTLL